MIVSTGVEQIGVKTACGTGPKWSFRNEQMRSDIARVVIPFGNRLTAQGCWIDPHFKGEAAAGSNIQAGIGWHGDKAIAQMESLPHLAGRKGNATLQYSIVASRNILGATLPRPPCHHSGWWRRAIRCHEIGRTVDDTAHAGSQQHCRGENVKYLY